MRLGKKATEKHKRNIGDESIDPKHYYDLGVALQNQGKLDEAVSCYIQALQLKPDYASAFFNLGSAFQDQGNLEEAISCYRKTVELEPDMAEAYINLGNAFHGRGEMDDPGGGGLLQPVQQEPCEQQGAQVVDGPADLHPVLGQAALCEVGAGAVHEDIDPRTALQYLLGACADAGLTGQVA